MRTYAQRHSLPAWTSVRLRSGPMSYPAAGAIHDFVRIPTYPSSPVLAQAKFSVSSPGDAYEQEADRIASEIMRMNDSHAHSGCSCGGTCSKCQADLVKPPITQAALQSSGEPLDAATRAFFEPRFGHDFSQVRVHTGADAARSAQAIGARAYTAGTHVVFGETFDPSMTSSRTLLAHELAHVVQQSGGLSAQIQRQAAGPASGAGSAMPAGTGKCYTCDIPGGLGICCYSEDAPVIEECFNMAKQIIDECKGSQDECLRQAQCAQCKCIAAKAGEKYCQCTGMV